MEITSTIKIDEQELSKMKGGDGSRVVSQYARIFSRDNPKYKENADDNIWFLKSIQALSNHMLMSRSYLYLNEVYEMLGLPRVKEFNRVGWIYDDKNPIGDNFVDFDIPCCSAFDDSDGILLDFNVDGDMSNYFWR